MKNKIKVFVSYAHTNKVEADRFIKLFKDYIAPSKMYEYTIWKDTDLKVGEKWDEVIKKNLKEADCGLLLISTSFLNSNYIKNVELPMLLDGTKVIIPVALGKINFELHDLQGLESYQIFRYLLGNSNEYRSFSEVRGKTRMDFIDKLFKQLEGRLRESKKDSSNKTKGLNLENQKEAEIHFKEHLDEVSIEDRIKIIKRNIDLIHYLTNDDMIRMFIYFDNRSFKCYDKDFEHYVQEKIGLYIFANCKLAFNSPQEFKMMIDGESFKQSVLSNDTNYLYSNAFRKIQYDSGDKKSSLFKMKTLEYARTVPDFALSDSFLCVRILLHIEYQKASDNDIPNGYFDIVHDSILMLALKLYLLAYNE